MAAVWFQITAPVRRHSLKQRPSLVRADEITALLKIGNVRRFVSFRLVFGFADLADPFLLIYGIIQMRIGLKYIGLIMLVLALSQVVGGIVWTILREPRGTRRSMQFAALLRFAGIILAVSIPMIAQSDAWSGRFDTSAGSLLFVFAFTLIGLAQSTYLRNERAYMMRATENEALYPAAIMLMNITLLISAVAALIGAWIIDTYSIETALISAAVLSFIALLVSGILVGPRTLRRRFLSPTLRGPRKPVRVRKRRLFRRR